jgi:MscS family membrane protein
MKEMQHLFTESVNWLESTFKKDVWVVEVFLVVFITLLIHTIVSFALRRLEKTLQTTKNLWDDLLVRAAQAPLGILIWFLGLSFAVEIASAQVEGTHVLQYFSNSRRLVVLLVVAWFLIRFIRQVRENILHGKPGKKPVDKTLVNAVSQLLIVSVVITTTLIALQMFGIKVTALIAFGGIGGAGVAFAAKDLLGNFFGGLMIYMDRPFKVGDWIRSPDRNIEGTVEFIGWRLTRIRTFDKRPLFVPNGIFSNISVENPSRMQNRRIKTNVGLRYDDANKVAVIIKDVENMLRHHPEIDANQTLIVNLVQFGSSSLDFMVYTFTKTTDWVKFQAIQQDVFLKILDIIAGHGAECAFPTQTLHVPEPVHLASQAQ